MKTLQFDSLGGASGDMILATLLDLGANRRSIDEQLNALPLEPFALEVAEKVVNGLKGTLVTVRLDAHRHHQHHPPSRAHSHRTWTDIRRLLEESALPEKARIRALAVFQRLAEAEGKVHGIPPERVHFHEVGAVDSIVDIVGACLALTELSVDEVGFYPLPLGHGIIHCDHGVLPSPAPATVELLKGHPVNSIDEPFELVTPTGAALLTAWKTVEGPPSCARLTACGYGFGHRTLNTRPNVIRGLLFETTPPASLENDVCLVMECNLDDTSPELIGSLTQQLMEKEALDVFTTPVFMKKQRPGTLLTVLCREKDREALQQLIFEESTTFGIREYLSRRTILPRQRRLVETPFGPIHIKQGMRGGHVITLSPEYDDCRAAALNHNVPVRTVYEAAWFAARSS